MDGVIAETDADSREISLLPARRAKNCRLAARVTQKAARYVPGA